jgi:uroporphyrin-III C-methyltransferase/precorrin-2 dehydrogenase/sirohydrochlorin ferrochelatase/uroporphyrin-III C-methyltransferase
MEKGFVSLVGAGPGDPDLLTVKAQRLLKQASVVVYDRLVSSEIMQLVPTGVSCISVGKSAGQHCLPQHEINKLLVSLAKSGRRVVRLKGGDPYLFGRGGEEALVLRQHNIDFEVVPGVTAAAGCSAYSGIPLTFRGMNHGVRFLTGHLHNDDELDIDWLKIADTDCTLVIYMGLGSLRRISDELVNAGLPASTPTAAIHNGTTRKQQKVISTLADIPEAVESAGLKSPVIVIVGEVVSLSDELDWFGSTNKLQRLSEEEVEHNTFDLARA